MERSKTYPPTNIKICPDCNILYRGPGDRCKECASIRCDEKERERQRRRREKKKSLHRDN
jgi:hypothetical protein